MSNQTILTLNCGSSSIKFACVHHDATAENTQKAQRAQGIVENIGTPDCVLTIKNIPNHRSTAQTKQLPLATHEQALQALKAELDHLSPYAIGHRIVHGGATLTQTTRITPELITRIEENIPLAPLHNPANIQGIVAAQQIFPTLPHFAIFDTAFHSSLPEHAYLYAVPHTWHTQHHVRRYGFHGTSHAYVSQQLMRSAPHVRNIVSAHLGNGSSLCAISAGKSIDTTMGLTPLEGLVMGTRCGNIDAGVLQYIASQTQSSLEEVTTVLNKQSGLLGLSGLSHDMRTLLSAYNTNIQVKRAIDVFCHQLKKQIMAMASNLSPWQALVFTGGIGENAEQIRAWVCQSLTSFGVHIDTARNQQVKNLLQQPEHSQAVAIHAVHSTVEIWVIPTDEEWQIAQECKQHIHAS